MKNRFTVAILLLFIGVMNAQTIEKVISYNKVGGTRVVAFLSDKSIWWYNEEGGWDTLGVGEIPSGEIRLLDVYQKGIVDTRLVTVMDDNSFWWFKGEWNAISSKGLPSGYEVKDFKAYAKFGMMGVTSNRMVALLKDNSLWWCEENKEWHKVSVKGLPKGVEIDCIRTFQKMGMGKSETRFIVKLKDNTIWWFTAKKEVWKKFEGKGLPKDGSINVFECYMKYQSGSMGKGRLLAVTDDQSIWWAPTDYEQWEKLSSKGLPEGYKIKSMSVYQKDLMFNPVSRLMVLLEDNTLWWFSDESGWSQVPTNDLGKL